MSYLLGDESFGPFEFTMHLDITVDRGLAGALWSPAEGETDAEEPLTYLYDGVWAAPELHLVSKLDLMDLTLETAGDLLKGDYSLPSDSEIAGTGDCELTRIFD